MSPSQFFPPHFSSHSSKVIFPSSLIYASFFSLCFPASSLFPSQPRGRVLFRFLQLLSSLNGQWEEKEAEQKGPLFFGSPPEKSEENLLILGSFYEPNRFWGRDKEEICLVSIVSSKIHGLLYKNFHPGTVPTEFSLSLLSKIRFFAENNHGRTFLSVWLLLKRPIPPGNP